MMTLVGFHKLQKNCVAQGHVFSSIQPKGWKAHTMAQQKAEILIART